MLEIIAHRGASAYAPENTMPAFELAQQMGAKMIEFDVILSLDKVPVIIHDTYLNRTTNGKGKVNQKTYQYIQSLDAGSWFDKKFKGTKVPSLVELLEWHKSVSIYLNLEIKPIFLQSFESDLDIILDQVYRFADLKKIKILSFQSKIFTRLKTLNINLPKALEVSRCYRQTINVARACDCQQINFSYRYLNAKRIAEIHDAGLKVGIFTVNQLDRLKKLQFLGVDEVFTDDLKLSLL